jgi:hypothetical protein
VSPPDPAAFLAPVAIALVAVVAATARPVGRSLRGVAWHPATLLLAVAAPAALWVALPPEAYHYAGHEGAYGELLDGGRPWEDLGSYRILPAPSALAAALGEVLPGRGARWIWGLLNRGALVAVLLFGAAAAASLAADRGPRSAARAGLATALGLLAIAPLLGWSATAWAVVPALACGLAALLLGMAGQPGAALAWGAIALGTRMEDAAMLVAAVGAAAALRPPVRGRRAWGLLGGALILALIGAALATRGERLPVESGALDPELVLENLRAIGLGGAWLTPWTLATLLALLLAERGRWRRWAPVALGGLVAVAQLAPMLDLGARHLLPFSALAAVLGGGVAGGRRGWTAALLAPVIAAGLLGADELAHRYAAGPSAHLPAWTEAADAGPAGPLEALLDPACYLVLPNGEEDLPGASPAGDVNEVHNAALELADGRCVQWAVHTEAEFLGDCAAERFDRARRVLRLRPEGWVVRPDGARWLLWKAP